MAVSWPLAAAATWFKNVSVNEAVMQANVTDPLNDLNTRVTGITASAGQMLRTAAVTVGATGAGRGTASGSNPLVVNGFSSAKNYGQMQSSVTTGAFTVPTTGLYRLSATVSIPAAGATVTGRVSVYFEKNGVALLNPDLGPDDLTLSTAGPFRLRPGELVQLAAGDVITLAIASTSSTAITPTPYAYGIVSQAS